MSTYVIIAIAVVFSSLLLLIIKIIIIIKIIPAALWDWQCVLELRGAGDGHGAADCQGHQSAEGKVRYGRFGWLLMLLLLCIIIIVFIVIIIAIIIAIIIIIIRV